MHEVAIAQGILDVVLDLVQQQEVKTVRVRAGEQQALTQESLQFCFEMVALDTPAAAARIDLELAPGDSLTIEAIELDDGWHLRPDLASSTAT